MKEQRVEVALLSPDITGIYESLKVYRSVFFRMEEHLDRFFDSARSLGLEVPKTRGEIRAELKRELAESRKRDAFVRLTLVGDEIFIVVSERKHSGGLYKRGVLLKTATVRRKLSNQEFPEAKSTSCVNQVLGTLDPAPAGNYEILFLNSEGYLTEARIGNFFMVKEGRLLTPPPVGLLNGVTRRFVIECAHRGKIPFEERPLMRHDLFNAEEAFLTNTSWEILPIREVDGRRVGGEIPGPVTAKLQKIFRSQVKKEIQKAKGARPLLIRRAKS